jgi:AcrR family transcriptional regulator
VASSVTPDAPAAAAPPGKRERLIDAARRLFHQQGVEKTALADIAAAAGVPVGNVFYYFKTKDALIDSVIETYGAAQETLSAVAGRARTPQGRLKALIRSWAQRRDLLAEHGCPIGSLSSELAKRDGELRDRSAAVLAALIDWSQAQFAAMGRRDARELAVALISAYEGVALLANALRDPGLIAAESRRLERWVDDLAADEVTVAHPGSVAEG